MSRTKRRQEYLEMLDRAGAGVGHGRDAMEKLARLARRAFRAGEYWCSVPDPNAERAYEAAKRRVVLYAASLGLETHWHGLWPTFVKEGVDVYIPD